MARLLITGGAGFIGSHFVRHWLATHPDDHIVVLDALTYAGTLENLKDCLARVEFVEGNICDQALCTALLRNAGLDTIVHFAAESHVDRSITGPDVFLKTNIEGTHSLLKAAKQVWLDESGKPSTHRFHHISTDEVYGSLGPNEPAFTEESPYRPNSPYAASKAAADHLVRAYHQTYGLQTSISNCSNNFGPCQHQEKLIPVTIESCLTGKPIPVYGDGQQIRDWLHVDDHCHAIARILLNDEAGETYNIGGRCELSNLALIQQVCEQLDRRFQTQPELSKRFPDCPAAKGQTSSGLIQHVADRPGHDRRYAIDDSKLRSRLKHHSAMTFEQGLQTTLDWHLAQNTD